MDERELADLLKRYKNGKCSPEEVALVESIIFPGDDQEIKDQTQAELDDKAAVWHNLNELTQRQPKRGGIYRVLPYAAAAAVIIGAIIVFATKQNPSVKENNQIVRINDVAPGTNRATLKLADGSVVDLEQQANGKIATQGDAQIRKSGSGKLIYASDAELASKTGSPVFNTLTTPKGGQYELTLPDGTKAWLNAASSISFPTNLGSSATRELSITGEVYFEVARDQSRPFRVSSATQTVEVLGTHFSINSYADEPQVKTSLLEGSVRITPHTLASGIVLKPGQQALLNQNKKIEIVPVDESEIAWKNGLIRVRNADLKTVMRQLARWYDLEVVYQGQISNESINAAVPRNSRLATVLELLSGIGVEFKIEQTATGKKIIVQGN
ncbi:FecR family protein [uncultured Chitinophaga sp.]|uniref:FecR family protein n=1 Tax=uncultured Chitinophaga sp. TaxID=339340 RepID=UPI0025DE3F0C|nr:FecR family protein [uncultured Chitinophaga sp.]